MRNVQTLLSTFNSLSKNLKAIIFITIALFIPAIAFASHDIAGTVTMPELFGIRVEFIMFAIVLLGVALFHDHTFWVAIIGLTSILIFKLIFDKGFNFSEHMFGETPIVKQFLDKEIRQGEWGILLNLLGLLLGFAVLAKVFEESGIPEVLPKFLPDDWKGPFVLLIFIFIMSSFLDNIAAALIGGTIAIVVFKGKVHIGYIAAIVAASNAGGAGSVVGDTTTTMMWIDGVSPFNVLHAFIASAVAFIFFAWFGAHQQDKFQRIVKDANPDIKIDWGKIAIVILILTGAIVSNVVYDMPALGVWIAIIIGSSFRKMPWHEIPASIMGTAFLLCLVMCASMMPVETLPDAHWTTAFVLGFVSAVFDNIPLTKLCLEQGHYDWGMLAYAVGFGGSMVWFGSSAGVAITNKFPEGRNVMLWVRKGWHVMLAYIIGFFALWIIWNWEPANNKKHTEPVIDCKAKDCKAAKEAKIIKLGEEQLKEQGE
jgi:Na+/H+ antiporter NhaD/arsenite permease-like protein